MQIAVELDEKLLTDAQSYSGLSEPTALLSEALTALIQREAARSLARLGGSEPQLKRVPRRRMPK